MKNIALSYFVFLFISLSACGQNEGNKVANQNAEPNQIILNSQDVLGASFDYSTTDSGVSLKKDQWLSYEIDVPVAGRYRVEIKAKPEDDCLIWIEDYIDNPDDRTYDITGKISFAKSTSDEAQIQYKEGSPLNSGKHKIKVHVAKGSAILYWVKFTLMKEHRDTPKVYTQKMDGKEWTLVWSDEFEGSGLPDTTKWSYNFGNWGWGNNEPQYYTSSRIENARLENGTLIIEARKNDDGNEWTSARLTTQGKESFLYGRIEFRAKVPVTRGTWSAGWLLGDEYRDELSWPYCGEIDVLECVGFEIDDSTGNGKNHATCHTRSYYFKQGNQIGSEIAVSAMNTTFHTYAIEWYPDVIYGFLDGEKYYTYDMNKDELEWPFDKAQNIIVNLAIGGGWGGAKGIDESVESHQYILDYVRVYELK
jgi:beta-glucanase (GH16 family)